MYIIQLRLGRSSFLTDSTVWVRELFKNNKTLCFGFAILRMSYILSSILRVMVMPSGSSLGFWVKETYGLQFALYFIQMVLYPTLLSNHFFIVNNLQMLIVLVLIWQTFYPYPWLSLPDHVYQHLYSWCHLVGIWVVRKSRASPYPEIDWLGILVLPD